MGADRRRAAYLKREWEVFGKKEYERLAGISGSRLYNLRRRNEYRKDGRHMKKDASDHGNAHRRAVRRRAQATRNKGCIKATGKDVTANRCSRMNKLAPLNPPPEFPLSSRKLEFQYGDSHSGSGGQAWLGRP